MKINEIELQAPVGMQNLDVDKIAEIPKETITILSDDTEFNVRKKDVYRIFTLEKNNEIKAYILAQVTKPSWLFLYFMVTPDKFRKSGNMKELIRQIYLQQYKMRLDAKMTQDGLDFWISMAKNFPIKVRNQKTGEEVDYRYFDKNIYDEKYEFIIEHYEGWEKFGDRPATPKKLFEIFGLKSMRAYPDEK